MPKHPLGEIFGFPFDNHSPQAARYRKNRLCPFNNKEPNCTKDKANAPLGVCSIFEGEDKLAITCPIRFRQDWLVTEDAARFFFPKNANWTSISEVRLNDRWGKSAGNIDLVLVSYDKQGHILDFGSLEIQAVYISGNVRRPFEYYMLNPEENHLMDWSGQKHYPRPDYLSSSRKRLIPQLMYKGGILKAWGKKQAVAIHAGFYQTLPNLIEVAPEEADIAWLIYELSPDPLDKLYHLELVHTAYTQFKSALDIMTVAEPGSVNDFVGILQDKLDEKLDNNENPPIAPTLADLLRDENP